MGTYNEEITDIMEVITCKEMRMETVETIFLFIIDNNIIRYVLFLE
jgi:hypothetical protein